MNTKRFHSRKAAAAIVGVHPSTIDRWVKAGVFIPKVKLGPSCRGFSVDEFDAWIAERRATAVTS